MSRPGDPGSGPEELSYEVRPAAGSAEGALVLLHGRGTDERDLLALVDELDPARRLVGLTPRGPLSLPPGGRHFKSTAAAIEQSAPMEPAPSAVTSRPGRPA